MMAQATKVCTSCGSSYGSEVLFCPKDGAPVAWPGAAVASAGPDPYLGRVVGEQIEIRQLVGVGSMGRVYRGYQRGVERDVAVKILHRELSAKTTLVQRFLTEARVASRLNHPHVVQVLMVGQLEAPRGDGGELYIAMEYLDGMSLMSSLSALGGAMPLPRALRIVLQICDAVGVAHELGIVHRDVKPENVMLVRSSHNDDFVKVLDFGIATLDEKATRGGEGSREQDSAEAGRVFGTAQYISPEGALGQAVTSAADVYAIATVLYQCLSGRTPFEAPTVVSMLMKHAYEPAVDLRNVPRASYVPAPISDVIMRNLSKNPSDRAADGVTLGRQLLNAAQHSGLSSEDLVHRSTLLGHSSVPVMLASVQRTKQMRLSAEAEKAIGVRADVADGASQPLEVRDASGFEPQKGEDVEKEAPATEEACTTASLAGAEPRGAKSEAIGVEPTTCESVTRSAMRCDSAARPRAEVDASADQGITDGDIARGFGTRRRTIRWAVGLVLVAVVAVSIAVVAFHLGRGAAGESGQLRMQMEMQMRMQRGLMRLGAVSWAECMKLGGEPAAPSTSGTATLASLPVVFQDLPWL